MSELDSRIQALFPDAVNRVDYTLRDDGDGPYIERWNRPERKPTQSELDAVTPEQVRLAENSRLDARAQREIDNSRALKAVVLWVAAKLAISPAQARNEIVAIYRTLR